MKKFFASLMVLIGVLLPELASGQPVNPTPPGKPNFSVQTNSQNRFTGVLLGANQVLVGKASALPLAATLPDCVGSSNALTYSQTTGLFTCNTIAGGTLTIGGTSIISGNPSGLLYNLGGNLGNLATGVSGVLVTDISGNPSISSSLPTGLALQTPASIALTNATGLPTSAIVAQSANTLLGSLTISSPAAISVPSCDTVTSALTWTLGSGFGCNTIAGGTATTVTVGVTTVAGAGNNGILFNSSGTLASITSVNSGALVTDISGVPTVSTTLPSGLALNTPASINLTNATGLPLTTGVTGNLPFSNLTTLSANTVLGATTARTPLGLAVPSCSAASNALIWTSGTGFGCNTITTIFSVGVTPVTGASGQPNGIFYNASQFVGIIASAANAVLVTDNSSVPSLSTTLPNMALGTPTSIALTHGTGLPLSTGIVGNLPNTNLSALGANTLLGALSATTPSGLAVPSCNTANSALIWTSGVGFGCNAITTSTVIAINTTSITSGISNGLLYDAAGVVGNLTTVNNGVLVTNGGGIPSISTTLPNMALSTPTSITLTNATGLPLSALPAQTANTVLGSIAGTAPIALAVPSCNGAASALSWTSGGGFGCTTISAGSATSITVGVTTVSTGTPSGLLYNLGGSLGNLATGVSGVLVTDVSGNPSISSSLPTGLALQTPASITLTNGTNLPNSGLATQTANTVLGAISASTPVGLAMPSCSTASNALKWTTGTGFGCNTFSVVIGTTTVTSGTPNGLLFDSAGTVGNLATIASGVLVTSAGSVPSISTTLPNIALGTPTSIALANGTGLPLTTGVTGLLPGANGGTGVANTGFTMTVGGNFSTGGALAFATMSTANNLLYVSSAGNVSSLTSIASAVLVTNGSGVPSISTTLPNMAHGTPTSIALANGTGLPLTTGVTGLLPGANGGTGVANTGFTMTVGGNFSTGGALTFANMTTTSDLLYVTSAGNVGQLATAANAVLVTNGSSVPSISTTLPNMAHGTPTSITLTNGTGLPLTGIATISANTLLGALSATTPSALAVPSCSAGNSALTWTPGSGFGCNTITALGPTVTDGTTSVTNTTTLNAAKGIAVSSPGANQATFTLTFPGRTVTTSPTIGAGDMNGAIYSNVSGGGTLTVPAIAGAVFASGVGTTVVNYSASIEAISTTPTINAGGGCVTASGIPAGGAWTLTGNGGATLDCFQTVSTGNSNWTAAAVSAIGSTLVNTSGTLSVGTVPITSISGTDRSSAIDPTIAASDMGNQINLTNSGSLTVVLPAKGANLWQPGQTLRLVAQGTGTVTFTNSTTLTAAGTCSSIPGGTYSALDIAANSDGTHLDCQPMASSTSGGTTYTASTPNIVIAGSTIGTTVPTNAQSGSSYAILTGDNAKTILMTNGSTTTMSIPVAGSAGFTGGWAANVIPTQAATTITPATGTICEQASQALDPGQFLAIGAGSGTDYFCALGLPPVVPSGTIASGKNLGYDSTNHLVVASIAGGVSLSSANTWTASQRVAYQTPAISTATFTPAVASGNNIRLNLTSACPCTLANFSGTLVAGQQGVIEAAQDSGGSRTIGTWGSEYVTAGGTSTISLSTAGSAVDYIPYAVDSTATLVVLGAIIKAPSH